MKANTHPKAVQAAKVSLAKKQERARQRAEVKSWTRKYRLRFFEIGDVTFCVHQQYRIVTISTALFNPNDKRRDAPLGRYIAAQRWVDGERIQLALRYGTDEWALKQQLNSMA